ncbi:MAG: hypothetical protein QG610_1749 [Euryarchaeota archaeon]|nr:hypothetical protein [Euryarchaeota archaeon]
MNTIVIYQTENGIFQFNLFDVIEKITNYGNAPSKIYEAITIISFLSLPFDNPIFISKKNNHFQFICLELISENKGDVECKICREKYQPNQLRIIRRAGYEQNQVSNERKQYGWVRRLFSNGEKQRIGNFGWKGIECPVGHELIPMVITWIS